MILVLFLIGDVLEKVSSAAYHDGCFCFNGTLNCSRQSLLNVPDIPKEVTNVNLAYNLIFKVNNEDKFQKLEILDLSHNRLKILELDLSRSSLKYLKLTDNPLNYIFINSTMLKHLDISWCDINHLKPDFLDMTPMLEILDVSHNPLKVIHHLKGNLKELYVQGCLFRKISFELPQLEVLDISHNRYMTFLQLMSNLTILKASHGKFHQAELSLPNLKVLDISNNRLSDFYFSNPKIEELDISWNSLKSLNLVNVGVLKLDLSHNLLQDLEFIIDDLIFLNVSYNPLQSLKIYSRFLDMVDCSSCQLKHFELPKVHTLNLSRNGLEEFRGDATYLDLSHNLLDAFSGKAKLVDLRGNRLSLPKRVSLIGRALLSNNPWFCKCDDVALKELYAKVIDRVSCVTPEIRTWDSCFNTKLPKYMRDYPWVPLAVSGFLTVLVVIGIYGMKRRLWRNRRAPARPTIIAEENEPIRERVEDRLPSYEEALLMNKPTFSSRRSYEIVPNRRPSSSSI